MAAVQLIVLAALVAGCALAVLRPDPEQRAGLDAVLAGVTSYGATLLCLTRAAFIRYQRWAWATMGLGLLCSATGDFIWATWIRHLDPIPAVSIADPVWLLFFPCAYVTLVLLVRSTVVRFHPSVWLDGVIGGLGAAAIAAALAFGTIVDGVDGDVLAVTVNLAYPVADLVLLTLVIGVLALFGWRPDRAWWLLATGMVTYAVADTVYLFQLASGTYREGTWLELLWPAATAFFGLSAWSRPRRDRPARLEGWAVLVVPSLFAISALAVLVLDHFFPVPTLAITLATGCVLAAVVRAGVTFREMRSLADSRRQARTDDLTGLPNRRMLFVELDRMLARPGSGVLLLLGLDRFKDINDALGHHVGDRLLVQVGPRLRTGLRADDVVARLGSDEFAVLLPDVDASDAADVAARLVASFDEPFALEGVALHVDASIGLSRWPDHATNGTALLRQADNALTRAKATRSGWQAYTAEDGGPGRDRLELIEDLRTALANGELVLHYQPKVDLVTGAVSGVEALARWVHPRHGLLYPDAFVPLAERTGLMRAVTSAVLRMAMRQCRAWRDAGIDLSVAVNLSVSNLVDAHLATEIGDLLAEFGLPADRLELEITESMLMKDVQRGRQVLEAVRALGVRVAIDDYGTGYSSLSYLQRLPIDDLKIDKSFVFGMTEDAGALAIVHSTIELAHRLGLRVVAEGVESAAHLERLTALGCDVAQGYHIARPMPDADLAAWWRASRWADAPPAAAHRSRRWNEMLASASTTATQRPAQAR